MVVCVGLCVLGTRAGAEEPARKSIAILPFQAKAVSRDQAAAMEEALRTALDATGLFEVVPRERIATALHAASWKKLAQCKDTAACIARIAAQIHVDLIAKAAVVATGKTAVLSVEVIDVAAATVVTFPRRDVPVRGDSSDAITAIAQQVAEAVKAAARPAVGGADEEAPPPAPVQAAPEPVAAEPAPAPVEAAPRKPPRSSNGFVFGIELAGGPWSASAQSIVNGASPTTAFPEQTPTALGTAQAFTAPMDGNWLGGLNLHLGWNVLGYGALEAAIQSSLWSAFNANRGGAGFAGGRATLYPLQFFLPDRPFDVGVELGGGYSIAGGPTYGMDGTYFQFGITAEYYVSRGVSFEIFYRLMDALWNRFYTDFNNHESFPVSGFHALWNTLGIGVNFHAAP
jgi:TolB-like protein